MSSIDDAQLEDGAITQLEFLRHLEEQHHKDQHQAKGSPRPLDSRRFEDKAVFDQVELFPSLQDAPELVKFDEANPNHINHATLTALVVQLTSPEVIDYSLVCDFFLTYRLFVTSEKVMEMLMMRLAWALELCRSLSSDKVKVGKSVVVRTFVVLRHWILNYYLDDFDNYPKLGDEFVTGLNHLATSGLITPEDRLEAKVIADLKAHWVVLLTEFASYTPPQGDVDPVTFELPPSSSLKQKRDRDGVHTNPAWRRSAMLSLYDGRHPMLVYDEEQVAPTSLNQLLLNHKSSRLSLQQQLGEYQASHRPYESKKAAKHPHNHMNLVDSSRALPEATSIEASGFATNGTVKLQSSKVKQILPGTPVKKMQVNLPIDDVSIMSMSRSGSGLLPPPKFALNDEIGRKSSIKKLVEGWKKTIGAKMPHSPRLPNSASEQTITSERTITSRDPVAISTDRLDVLAARIVDELEYMLQYYIKEDHQEPMVHTPAASRHLGSPTRSKTPPFHNIVGSREEIQPVKMGHLKGDDLAPQEDITDSFQKPASIVWNSDINFNESDDEEHIHDCSPIKITIPRSTLDLDFTQATDDEKLSASFDSVSTPSNISQFDAEVAELGITSSPIKQMASPKPSMEVERFSADLHRQESVKSYVSYDSAFSVHREVVPIENGGLRKKHGYYNLRTMAGVTSEIIPAPGVSSLNNRQRSLRLSTLCALTELPFSSDFEQKDTSKSDNGDSSIFSVAVKSRTSGMRDSLAHTSDRLAMDKQSVRQRDPSGGSVASVAIPGISNYVLKELAAIPDESFATNDPVEFTLGKLEGRKAEVYTPSSRQSHFSNDLDLVDEEADVCATPDITEFRQVRQIGEVRLVSNWAQTNSVTTSLALSEELSRAYAAWDADNTSAIMSAINNADTEDIDTTGSIHTPEPPLTPHTPFGTSTPLRKSLDSGLSHHTIPAEDPGGSQDTVFMDAKSGLSDVSAVIEHKLPSNYPVEEVVSSGSHVSFILGSGSTELAHHFTAIERDMLQEIDWKDLIEHKWHSELTPVNSWLEVIANDEYFDSNQGVNLVIARFNLMVNWIISEVLLTKVQQERVAIISRMIHVAQTCLVMQNYSTVMQIVLALTSEKLQRLKETWMNLNPGDILMLKNLEELASPLKNFLNIRIAINNMNPQMGCVPFVGLYLSDLIFNSERPTFIKAKEEKSTDKLVNFSKFRTSVHIVKSLSQCIEWSNNYRVDVNQDLLSRCLYIKSLDEDEMNYCVDHIEDP